MVGSLFLQNAGVVPETKGIECVVLDVALVLDYDGMV